MRIETSDNSMYAIGHDHQPRGQGPGLRRGARSKRKLDHSPENFDFDKCDVLSNTALRLAIISRSEPALEYISDVFDDLVDNAEVCAHLIDGLARTPELIASLVELKRRCLLTTQYTHTYFLQAEFLSGSIRVRANGGSEKEAKQQAQIALIKALCQKVLDIGGLPA